MIRVTILHEAEVELREAVAYYEEKSRGLGLDLEAEIERSIRTIRDFPHSWPVREDGRRRYLTHRFPYLVIYTYLKDRIWIMKVIAVITEPEEVRKILRHLVKIGRSPPGLDLASLN